MRRHVTVIVLLWTATTLQFGCSSWEPEPEPESDPSGAIVSSEATPSVAQTFSLNLGIYVVNQAGDFVPGLTEENFSIATRYDDLDSVTFTCLEALGERTAVKGSYSATLLLDQTESIQKTDPYHRRIQAARIFCNALGASDYALLSSFSADYGPPYVRLHTNYTQDTVQLNDGLDALLAVPDGGTPLLEATSHMTDYTAENAPGTNKAVIVFTDGDDTEGGVSLTELTNQAIRRGVQLYTVGLGRSVKVDVLAEMARRTDGAFLWAENARQLISGFGTLGNLLSGDARYYQTRWEVGYTSDTLSSGASLVFEVVVTLPNDKEFIVPFEVVVP